MGAKIVSKHKIDHPWARGGFGHIPGRWGSPVGPLPALFFPNSLRLLKGGICEAAAKACGNRPSAFARTGRERSPSMMMIIMAEQELRELPPGGEAMGVPHE